MQPLLRGTLAPRGYAVLMRNLYEVYVALERGLDAHAEEPALAAFRHAGLRRSARIASDLDLLSGARWAESLPVALEARRYVDRLTTVADGQAALLLAHAYVRYFGDLSGGRQIARIVKRVLPADAHDATAFYEFPDIPDADAFKVGMRGALDALALVPDDIDAIVAEARWGFSAHAALFEELAGLAA
jgi:heme oxygenase